MDNNPQKPVVRMANLCVVSAHTVSCSFNGNLVKLSFLAHGFILAFLVVSTIYMYPDMGKLNYISLDSSVPLQLYISRI